MCRDFLYSCNVTQMFHSEWQNNLRRFLLLLTYGSLFNCRQGLKFTFLTEIYVLNEGITFSSFRYICTKMLHVKRTYVFQHMRINPTLPYLSQWTNRQQDTQCLSQFKSPQDLNKNLLQKILSFNTKVGLWKTKWFLLRLIDKLILRQHQRHRKLLWNTWRIKGYIG